MRRSSHSRFNVMPLVLVVASLVGCATHTSTTALAPAPTMTSQTSIPNLKQPRAMLLTAGQPDATAWQQLANDGVRTVINLRPDSELGARDEAAEVIEAGMRYQQIAVAGAADLTAANARALWSLLEQAEGTTLVHCSSSNRVGALLALGAKLEGGMDTEAALAFGRSAGLAGAEPRVRELLEALPAK